MESITNSNGYNSTVPMSSVVWNTHTHLQCCCFLNCMQHVFWNVGIYNSDAGELPKRKHNIFRTQRKFEIKVSLLHVGICCKSLVSQVALKGSKGMESLDPILPVGLLIGYCVMARRLRTILHTVLLTTPKNICQFGHHKKHLGNKRFATDTDMLQAVIFWLWTLDTVLVCWHTTHVATVGWMFMSMMTTRRPGVWHLPHTYTVTSE